MPDVSITLYQSRNPSGTVRRQVAGLAFAPTANGFTVASAALPGIKPKAGDTLTAGDGSRHRVTAVAPAAGAYTLTCEAEGGAP